jgi:CRP-like cAMP-binding protein
MQLTKQEIIILRETFLFHRMSVGTYRTFTSDPNVTFTRLHLAAGETVVLPQEPEHCLGILISGQLYAVREPKFPNQRLDEGFVLGALDLFSTVPVNLPEITAETDSDLLLISVSQMEKVFQGYPEVMLRYIYFLTGQLHNFKWEHDLATTASVEARLLHFLSQYLEFDGDEYRVTLPYSYSVLAGRLNMSRSTLYRTFDHLEQAGLLKRQEKTMIILQPELLPKDGYL